MGIKNYLVHFYIDPKGTEGVTTGADCLVLRASLVHDELKPGGGGTENKILQLWLM